MSIFFATKKLYFVIKFHWLALWLRPRPRLRLRPRPRLRLRLRPRLRLRLSFGPRLPLGKLTRCGIGFSA